MDEKEICSTSVRGRDPSVKSPIEVIRWNQNLQIVGYQCYVVSHVCVMETHTENWELIEKSLTLKWVDWLTTDFQDVWERRNIIWTCWELSTVPQRTTYWEIHHVIQSESVFNFGISLKNPLLDLTRYNNNAEIREGGNYEMRDTKGMRHGTFTFNCVDCIIDQSNDSHYGGLWREKRRR